MIKFFRKIRQKLLSKNSFNKYLLYAIGEIVLVMIGILLALQVNNWNEKNKDAQKEKILLTQFIKSINRDLSDCDEYYQSRLDTKKQSLDSLFHYVKKHKINDTLFVKFYRNINIQPVLNYDDGPFRNLESLGLETISNDSLRTAINRAYSTSLPSLKKFADVSETRYRPEINKRLDKLMTHKLVTFKNGSKGFMLFPKVKNIINNEDFYSILVYEGNIYGEHQHRLRQMVKTLKNLREAITKELEL